MSDIDVILVGDSASNVPWRSKPAFVPDMPDQSATTGLSALTGPRPRRAVAV